MEIDDLPPLEFGKLYDVKILSEQPTKTPIIKPDHLGTTHRIELTGYGPSDIGGIDVVMISGKPVPELPGHEGREVVKSFHLWLIDTITKVECAGPDGSSCGCGFIGAGEPLCPAPDGRLLCE
mgnify:CR=1 FL=1